MTIESYRFSEARRASGLTLERAADACGLTRQTYRLREERAQDFHLGELQGLKNSMNETGQRLLYEALNSIFLPN